ncbi:MAG: hypothetical protein ACPGF8_05445 [Opitutales bacterium]
MSDNTIINPPKNCHCGAKADQVRIEVYGSDGRLRLGVFSEFGTACGRNGKLGLKPNYRFKRWLVHCNPCGEIARTQEELFA